MSQTPRLEDVLAGTVDDALHDVWTALPGTVVSYDAKTQTASVRPGVRNAHQDEEGDVVAVDIAVLPSVPVVFPGAGDYSITFPVKAGDGVLLVFCSRDIGPWKGATSDPANPVSGRAARRHSLADAIAIPGLRRPSTPVSPAPASDALVLKAPLIRIGDNDANDPVVRKSDLASFISSYNAHLHTGGTIAGSTGVPTPLASTPACSTTVKVK